LPSGKFFAKIIILKINAKVLRQSPREVFHARNTAHNFARKSHSEPNIKNAKYRTIENGNPLKNHQRKTA
jgi:hypothetical protein